MSYNSIFKSDLFADQTILVTGGGSGIGRAIAHELASLGANVIIAGRTVEKLEAVSAEIKSDGNRCSHYQVNIRDESSVESLFKRLLGEHDGLYGLVNNAGGQFMSPAQHISKKGWHAVVETNLTGTFLMSKAAFQSAFARNGGAIVNIIAEMWRGFPGMAHTGAARAGVDNLTKTLAVEWAHAGVRVNSVAPGLIDGSGFQSYGEHIQSFIREQVNDVPLKRFGTEAEIAAAVTFLLSPAAGYITGANLNVDGASSLWRKGWEIEMHGNAPQPWDGFASE